MTDAATDTETVVRTLDGPEGARALTVRVALADDNLLVREGVAQLLAGQRDIEVVASCHDLDSLLQVVEDRRPDVVVTDIRMPPTHSDEGIRLAALLRERHPEVGVVVLSNYAEAEFAKALLESGCEGRAYLLKERVCSRTQLASAIHSVAAGSWVMDPTIVEPLVAARSRFEHSPLTELTAREREVLAEIAQGKSNAAIAESLVITKRAVEKHVNSIFQKLGLTQSEGVSSRRVKAALMFLADDRPEKATDA